MSLARCLAPVGVFAALLSVWPAPLQADILGFGDLADYQYNEKDNGSPPAVAPGWIQFTGGGNQRRSLWHKTPQNITAFEASFTYRLSDVGASGNQQGIAFVLHNNPAGVAAMGAEVGGLFGYSGLGYSGLTDSVAFVLATDTGPAKSYVGVFQDGALGGGGAETTPVNAFSGKAIDISLAYNGSTLSVTLDDGTNVSGPTSYLVGSLESILGGPTAYVGFTASTANGGATQELSNFQFVPEPAGLVTAGLGGVFLLAQGARAARNRRFALS